MTKIAQLATKNVFHICDFVLVKVLQTHLWMEKEIKSVANVTCDDVWKFLKAASKIPLKPDVKIYSFDEANEAIMDIKNRKIRGAKGVKI